MLQRRSYFFSSLFILGISMPLLASAEPVIQSFEVLPTSINSGQTITLSWKTTSSSGASLLLPCQSITGIHYKNQSGTTLPCDQKITGLGTVDSILIGVTNTSGSAVSLSPKLIPINPDGSESTAQVPVTFSIATSPNPITDFSVSTPTAVSGDKVTFSWSAPDVDRLNMTLYCTDVLTPTIVGDARPRVPCNQEPVFIGDVSGSGSQTFQLVSSSLEPVSATFRLLPKTSSGTFDGTHAKSITINVKPALDTRSPIISSFRLSEQTLKSGQETSVIWDVLHGVGANFKLKCPVGVTATSSLTGAARLPCDGAMIFSGILDVVGSFRMSFQNTTPYAEGLSLTLVPAVTTAEFDAIRTRELRIVILGNAGGSFTPPVSQVNATTSAATSVSQPAPRVVFLKSISYGLRNSAEVRKIQEILRDEGVYTGPVTGNFLALTREAVKRFQKKYGLDQVGNIGPLTRKKLNEIAGKQ
ncbi:MAG: peptidoglycan-binding protein [Candidatus Sungbacteria bacterium]|uniref:Peptidoglycan-binding protein n=1 Tax=Candidatus Sungiibacteriota bacterium TaxID=2750080 RepID=A0A931SBG9_9BACT|nr:peptidoglycan-binding protein [Candidatus Sungbacteria bacterium]